MYMLTNNNTAQRGSVLYAQHEPFLLREKKRTETILCLEKAKGIVFDLCKSEFTRYRQEKSRYVNMRSTV